MASKGQFGGGCSSSKSKSLYIVSMTDYDAQPVSNRTLCYTQNQTRASRALEDYCVSMFRTISNGGNGEEAIEQSDVPMRERSDGWHIRFIEADVAKSPSVTEIAEIFSVERDAETQKMRVHRARRLQCEIVSMCLEDLLHEASDYDAMFLEAPCVSCFANAGDEDDVEKEKEDEIDYV